MRELAFLDRAEASLPNAMELSYLETQDTMTTDQQEMPAATARPKPKRMCQVGAELTSSTACSITKCARAAYVDDMAQLDSTSCCSVTNWSKASVIRAC